MRRGLARRTFGVRPSSRQGAVHCMYCPALAQGTDRQERVTGEGRGRGLAPASPTCLRQPAATRAAQRARRAPDGASNRGHSLPATAAAPRNVPQRSPRRGARPPRLGRPGKDGSPQRAPPRPAPPRCGAPKEGAAGAGRGRGRVSVLRLLRAPLPPCPWRLRPPRPPPRARRRPRCRPASHLARPLRPAAGTRCAQTYPTR